MENYHQNTRASLWIKAILCCSPKQEEIEEGAEANFSCCSSACYSWHRVTAELSGNRNFWTCQDANRDLMAYVYSSKDGKLYLPTSCIHMYFKYVGEFVNNTQHPVWKALKCLFFLSWQQRHPIPFTSSVSPSVLAFFTPADSVSSKDLFRLVPPLNGLGPAFWWTPFKVPLL